MRSSAHSIVSETVIGEKELSFFPGEAVLDLVRNPYKVHYGMDMDLREIPLAILQAPYILNLVPTLWATGKEYRIDTMDEDLFRSLEKVQSGFRTLYPHVRWTGKLIPEKLEKIIRPSPKTRLTQGLFFSGGVDSTYSALRCKPENTVLLSIRGHDIGLDKETAWETVRKDLESFARDEGFLLFTVEANVFRSLRYGRLHSLFPDMKPWYGTVQHGLALSSLAFPLAFHEGWDSVLFSSSVPFSVKDGPWGSHFLIEPHVAVGGCRVVYFGSDIEWAEKAFSIAEHYKARPDRRKPFLRVCLDGMSGEATRNCCRCEKCLRAISSLLVCGENPAEWGFPLDDSFLETPGDIFSALRVSRSNAYHWRRLKNSAATALDGSPAGLIPFLSALVRWDLPSHLY